MPLLVFLGALLALWLFVVWDRRRLTRSPSPASRDQMERGVAPRVLKWPACAGLAFLAGLLGVYELLLPSRPPFTGKFSWLQTASYSVFGEVGVAYAWFGISFVTTLVAISHWRSGASVK